MFRVSDLYLLAPALTVTLLALVVMTVDLFVKRRVIIAGTALIGLIVPAAFLIAQAVTYTKPQTAFFGMLVIDQYAIFFNIIFILIAAVMILASYDYVGKYVKADGEFFSLMLFSVAGMMFMASTGELITIYIALELTSIPLYVMAGMLRGSAKSSEAAVKYVLLGGMSSAILLYGFALLYGLTGTTDLVGIAQTFKTSLHDGNLLVIVADVLIMAGFGFKISAVPFHMWAPDIYEGAPAPATAFFSVGSKAAGFAALIRVFIYGGLGQVNLTSLVLVIAIIAVMTMTLGNLVAAVQKNVRRMMAYSSIAQAGYLLVGFVASLASNNAAGNAALLFFILIYVITNLGAFGGIIALANLTGGETVDDFRGMWKRSPLLSVCTAFCLLSLAGIPPLAGFLSKVVLFTAAWNLGQQWLVVVALLNSIVSLVYYGRLIKTMFFDEPGKTERITPTWGLSTSMVLATAALLVLTVAVQFVLNIATPAAQSLLFLLK
ncbi:NADH-quinone oxidoreductase subunit N [Tengunoibacter tsumagoiensis]|uniref:NADH-quinone oxidoreductase subunit N n=1 Tax=Tengunoibacter tsumagoiensis TaxID=2014871 RepID=A0A401ZX54_9CHLR|nr:NADH-quinone oxidoreductase subunit N [Tengunoibacter tsumagoiensis]GCE11426.1 NADH-quinone oxidoreductase subunit N [Tengunoibacter tsumagoiensis]